MARASVLAAVALAVVVAARADAAAPSYILVTGPGLAKPVLLASWAENGMLLSSFAQGPRARQPAVRGLARRPRFGLAEFWGAPAERPPARPSEAAQHGWFYPAQRGRRAVSEVTLEGIMVPRLVPPLALRILARNGIPIRT